MKLPGCLIYGGLLSLMLCDTPAFAAEGQREGLTNATAIPSVTAPNRPRQPEDTHLDKTPPRTAARLQLIKNGLTYNCMECHRIIPARWHYDRLMNEHQHIRLEHGNNRFCLNCHHPVNRNAFVDYDGAEIQEVDAVNLCAKCHGTIHRDWKAGVHGRQNGFWQKDMPGRTKLRCTECHDPHSPKFKPIAPLAPARYPLRAANPSVAAHVETHRKAESK